MKSPYEKPALSCNTMQLNADGAISPNEELFKRSRVDAFGHLLLARGRRYANCKLENFCDGMSAKVIAKHNLEENVFKPIESLIASLPKRLEEGKANIVMLGPPGTGKDWLLMAMMRSAILHYGYSVKWVDGMEFFASIKTNNFSNQDALFNECCMTQILAISDPVPPKGEIGNYDLTMLRRIVEHRYSDMMATWVTCNVLNPQEARQQFSSAVLERLIDGATQITCDWPSFRKLREDDAE